MAPRLPWFPLHVDDWLNSRQIRTMPAEAVGVYSLLLCHQWKDGPLPLEARELAMLCGRPEEEIARAWPHLERCFVRTADGWVNERLAEERRKQEERHERLSRGGRKGMQSRYGK
jgi:uncharacterized protein YdaU (DUF1376 family)